MLVTTIILPLNRLILLYHSKILTTPIAIGEHIRKKVNHKAVKKNIINC